MHLKLFNLNKKKKRNKHFQYIDKMKVYESRGSTELEFVFQKTKQRKIEFKKANSTQIKLV